MLQSKLKTRIQYAQTDQMGFVYHGNYAQYYQMGREDLLRQVGVPYTQIEKEGIIMPLIDLKCKFLKPALYDEIVTIETTLENIPKIRVLFTYKIFNEKEELINTGETTLVCLNEKHQPIKIPQLIVDAIKPFFK